MKRTVIFGSLVVLLLWAGSAFMIHRSFTTPQARTEFGDLFNPVNALFSGLAFLGVIVALVLQTQELEQQRTEIRETKASQEEAARLLSAQVAAADFRLRIEALNLVIDSLTKELARMPNPTASVPVQDRHKQLTKELTELQEELRKLIHDRYAPVRS